MPNVSRHSLMITAAIIVPLALGACGSGAPANEAEAGGEAAETAGPVVDPAVAATVTGMVNFEGVAPEAEPIDMSQEAACAEQHPEGAHTREVVANANGTLKNVFVYVTQGLGATEFPTPSEPVTLDQRGCIYHPHVLGIQTGQALEIRNSDGVLHNINATPEANRGFNISQPIEMTSDRTFAVSEVMIPVECDVHGWMTAYIGVVDHPFFAVTDTTGSFTIDGLPPGDYVIEAWHERYGVQTANVTVGASETAEISFDYAANMAANAVVPVAEAIDLHDHATAED